MRGPRRWFDAVVFADIDGVFNHNLWRTNPLRPPLIPVGPDHPFDEMYHARRSLDPAAVARLNPLCARTGAGVVISSSWRNGRNNGNLAKKLRMQGFRGPFLGQTPSRRWYDRGLRRVRYFQSDYRWGEIRRYLHEHPEVSRFVILDDEPWQDFPPEHTVRTSEEVGFTDADLERAVAILGERPAPTRARRVNVPRSEP